jgi:hypothetical protein
LHKPEKAFPAALPGLILERIKFFKTRADHPARSFKRLGRHPDGLVDVFAHLKTPAISLHASMMKKHINANTESVMIMLAIVSPRAFAK